jgi:hypothetical protein
LKVQIATGPALIALPILPAEIANQIESWPDEATGSPDGVLSVWMRLLLMAQEPELNLNGMANLAFVDWDSPQRTAQAVELGRAIRRLAIDLSVQGQPRLRELAIAAGADKATATALARSFTPQLMRDVVQDWFGQTANRPSLLSGNYRQPSHPPLNTIRQVAFSDDLLLDWSIEPDPLLSRESASSQADDWQSELSKRFDASKAQALGGWYRDDLTLSLRYRGGGHHDVVLKSLIDLSRSNGMNLTEQPAVQACLECHIGGDWRANSSPSLRDRLTKFTHRSHLDVRGLQDCRHCHELKHLASTEATIGDFVPLRKSACVTCHTSTAAGDHCTTCHRYHVGNVPTHAASP